MKTISFLACFFLVVFFFPVPPEAGYLDRFIIGLIFGFFGSLVAGLIFDKKTISYHDRLELSNFLFAVISYDAPIFGSKRREFTKFYIQDDWEKMLHTIAASGMYEEVFTASEINEGFEFVKIEKKTGRAIARSCFDYKGDK